MTPHAHSTDPAIDEAAAPAQAYSARALVRAVRWRSGLSAAQFARAFHIDPDLLEALEHGGARPDAALTAYLRVIDHAPEVVREAIARAGH
ncbi:helix-turn-helix domain-containing protein [Caulobacter sp. ErkDOM-E]|uniref:helix-turn-helix domain-containing protein n=1 Tax=Caulobacter sp. ErkDOM-E TaxID=3402778 RepID=UPI003AF78144